MWNKKGNKGVPTATQQKRIRLVSIGCGFDPWPRSEAQGSGVGVSWGVGHRHALDPVWLWLWRRPAAAAPIGPLAWEPPWAVGAGPKKTKRQGSSCRGSVVNESD